MIRSPLLRPALLGATLLLSACSGMENPVGTLGDMLSSPSEIFGNPLVGSGTLLGDTSSFSLNPNRPVSDAPNVNRVLGKGYEQEPLLPEGGNVWPGPLPPAKTMSDLQKEGPLGEEAAPEPAAAPSKPATKPAAKTSQAAPRPTGRVLQTPAGPGVVSIGTDGKETILLPNGQKGTVSPAGSGTAMVKLPDGRSYTVADPR